MTDDIKDTADTTIDPAAAEPARIVPELTDDEREQAEKEGVKEAYKQSAQTNFATRSATETTGGGDRWPDRSEIMQFAGMIDLGLEEFEKAIAADAKPAIPEGKVAGLLGLERSGKNRTQYVKAMMKRLGVTSVYDVTTAGPAFTNDVTPITAL
ncbi:MAG: hypothetical protein ACRYGK_03875 [Janthinobacterium lividum]